MQISISKFNPSKSDLYANMCAIREHVWTLFYADWLLYVSLCYFHTTHNVLVEFNNEYNNKECNHLLNHMGLFFLKNMYAIHIVTEETRKENQFIKMDDKRTPQE